MRENPAAGQRPPATGCAAEQSAVPGQLIEGRGSARIA